MNTINLRNTFLTFWRENQSLISLEQHSSQNGGEARGGGCGDGGDGRGCVYGAQWHAAGAEGAAWCCVPLGSACPLDNGPLVSFCLLPVLCCHPRPPSPPDSLSSPIPASYRPHHYVVHVCACVLVGRACAQAKGKGGATAAKVQVLLKDTIEGVGKANEVVQVNTGYYNNFLRPKNLATIISDEGVEDKVAKEQEERERIKQVAIEMGTVIEDLGTIVLKKKTGKDNNIFGTVTHKQVLAIWCACV